MFALQVQICLFYFWLLLFILRKNRKKWNIFEKLSFDYLMCKMIIHLICFIHTWKICSLSMHTSDIFLPVYSINLVTFITIKLNRSIICQSVNNSMCFSSAFFFLLLLILPLFSFDCEYFPLIVDCSLFLLSFYSWSWKT